VLNHGPSSNPREHVFYDDVNTWCATFFVNSASEDSINDDSFEICPMCSKENIVSLIPLQKNEADWIYNS
jgi:hypothetical protein